MGCDLLCRPRWYVGRPRAAAVAHRVPRSPRVVLPRTAARRDSGVTGPAAGRGRGSPARADELDLVDGRPPAWHERRSGRARPGLTVEPTRRRGRSGHRPRRRPHAMRAGGTRHRRRRPYLDGLTTADLEVRSCPRRPGRLRRRAPDRAHHLPLLVAHRRGLGGPPDPAATRHLRAGTVAVGRDRAPRRDRPARPASSAGRQFDRRRARSGSTVRPIRSGSPTPLGAVTLDKAGRRHGPERRRARRALRIARCSESSAAVEPTERHRSPRPAVPRPP